ncbi:hypothetical protein HanPSC8_Chr16g0704861 [Helianthus annuus]|nr:hypothetical protein HanPSC8_Chr16g0704861 [Helianthus annuus]
MGWFKVKREEEGGLQGGARRRRSSPELRSPVTSFLRERAEGCVCLYIPSKD